MTVARIGFIVFFIAIGCVACSKSETNPLVKQAPVQNNGNMTGWLLLSPFRNCQSFDLFLPGAIDTLKTFKENLAAVKTDTAFQTFITAISMIRAAKKLRNESYDDSFGEDLKFCRVLPVSAAYDSKAEALFKDIDSDERYRNPYRFYGNTLTEFYRTKHAYLTSVRVIRLPEDGSVK